MKKYFNKYLNQGSCLPQEVRAFVEIENNDRVIFYALSDLTKEFNFVECWVVVGEKRIYWTGLGEKKYVLRSQVKGIREQKGNVLNNLSILDENENIISTFWYGQKQNILFSQLNYILEQFVKGNSVKLDKSADELYQQGVLAPLLKKQSGETTKTSKVIWRLLSYMIPYKKEVMIGSIGAVGMTLVSLLPAYISGRLIDGTVKPFQDGVLKVEDAMATAWMIIGMMATAYIIREFFLWLRLKKMSIMGEKIARDLRKELYNHIQTLEMDFFSSKQVGSIISRVSNDTDRIWDFIAFGIVEVSISILMLLGLSSVLIAMDWKLGLIMTIPVPFLIFSIFLHGKKMQGYFIKCWRKWSKLTSVLSDTVTGIQVVKSFNQESNEMKKFAVKNEDAVKEFIGVHESWTKFWPALMISIHFVILSVWIVAMPRLMSTESSIGHLSAGTFVSFLLYMTMFSQPIEIIGQVSRMMNKATSSAYRIFEILDTPSSIVKNDLQKDITIHGEIKFEDVIFSYDGVRNVLKGVNLDVKASEMIGLVGASGGGKSTITKLINRFYDIDSGSISIDGVDIKDIEIGCLRKQIGVVHQDPYLFHGSIFDNICYGVDEVDLHAVINAAKISNCHDFIMKFKDGYDTVVGERGQTLSGGERQRISIARAILNDPKILILDEATSAVDTETERKIQDALDKVVVGRTVIAIAHRLSTLRKASRILVVKDGEIVEVGTHKELIDGKGEYFKLQSMQLEMYNLMHGKVSEREVTNEV